MFRLSLRGIEQLIKISIESAWSDFFIKLKLLSKPKLHF
jgi:hypothetical protein